MVLPAWYYNYNPTSNRTLGGLYWLNMEID